MIPEEKREETLKKKKQMLQKVFSKTKFGADVLILLNFKHLYNLNDLIIIIVQVPMVEVSAALNASE